MRPDITLFQDLHREFSVAIREWGASADAAPIWATVIMLVCMAIAALIVLAILRAGFKGRINAIKRKCAALKGEKKAPSAVSQPLEPHRVEVPPPTTRPSQTKSSRLEGQLELLADLRDRGKISQDE